MSLLLRLEHGPDAERRLSFEPGDQLARLPRVVEALEDLLVRPLHRLDAVERLFQTRDPVHAARVPERPGPRP